MKVKNISTIMCACACVLALSGCAEDKSLAAYKQDMTAFSTSIVEIDSKMNGIDPNHEDATKDMLSYLDEMDSEFERLAKMDVPDEFNSIETLAKDASSYMNEAVSLYHELFNAPYNEESAQLAKENYNRAMKRKAYICEILQGRIPSGDDISIVYENNDVEQSTETLQ